MRRVMADHMAEHPALLPPLLDSLSAPLVAWAPDGSLLACSRPFARLLELDTQDVSQRGRLALVHPDDRAEEQQRIERRIAGDLTSWRYRGRFMTRAGQVVRAEVRTTPLMDGDRFLGDLVECIEVGERLSVRDALDEQAAVYANLFEHINEAIYSLDSRGRIATANSAAERLFGRSLAELQSTPRREVLFEDTRRQQDALRERFLDGERIPRRIEFPIKRPNGEVRWVSGSLLMMRDQQGRLGQSWVIARDVTSAKAREEALARSAAEALQQAKIDALTGLGNRRAFDDALEACGALASLGQRFGLFVLDMDNLKAVNDSDGHAAGDEAICAFGRALLARTRSSDHVFRIGGDEFVVIVPDVDPYDMAERLAESVPFREPVALLHTSIGWAVLGEDTGDPREAFRMADSRMYEMKRQHRARSGR